MKSPLATRRRRQLREAIGNTDGAIDLASIMVGVLVIGIIGGVISASVFAVIPWSQDEAAKASLTAVRDAESVYFTGGEELTKYNAAGESDMVNVSFTTSTAEGTGKYLDYDGLVAEGLIQPSDTTAVLTNGDGTCFVSLAASATSRVYLSTNRGPDVEEYTGQSADTNYCVTDGQIGDAIQDIRLGNTGPSNPGGGSTGGGGNTGGNTGGTGGTGGGNTGTGVGSFQFVNSTISAFDSSRNGSLITGWVQEGYGIDPKLVRSTDGGLSFSQLPAVGVQPYFGEITTSDDGSVVISYDASNGRSASAGFWVSHDGGSSFTKVSVRNAEYLNDVQASADGQTVYANSTPGGNTAGRMWKSVDGGLSWSILTDFRGVFTNHLDVSPNGQVIVASASNYDHVVNMSRDGGATWTVSSVIPDSDRNNTMAGVDATPNGQVIVASFMYSGEVAISRDYGSSWTIVNVQSTGYGSNNIAISDDGDRIALLSNSKLYVSTNGGDSFQAATNTQLTYGNQVALSSNGTRVFASSGYQQALVGSF